MQFQPESVRSLFFCLEDSNQIQNCCLFLNCSTAGSSSSSSGVKGGKGPKNSNKTFNKKVSLKKKFKSKKKYVVSLESSGPKTRSSTKLSSKRGVITTKTQFEKIVDNVSNSLRSFQFQMEQFSLKQNQDVGEKDDNSVIKSFETVLQGLYFDINKLNNFLQKNSFKKSSKNSSKDDGQCENLKPSSSKSSKSSSKSSSSQISSLNQREKILSDSYLLIRILHFECNLIKYLNIFQTYFSSDISAICALERFNVVVKNIFNISRVYYSLLNKLNISKSIYSIHCSSKQNSSAIFAILVRILNNLRGISSSASRDDEIIEVETGENSVPEIRIKKSSKNSFNLEPSKNLAFLMMYLEQLVKRDLILTNFDNGQTIKQVKLNMIGVDRQNTMEFALNSSLVYILRDLLPNFILKFKNKSTFRQKIIEILAFVCMKRKFIS